jgi:creatinine amidohydrolase/Fe(II)-dependent formamide hydrolase-like protein
MGGQRELRELSKQLDQKYSSAGTRVHFCGDVYAKTAADVRAGMSERNLPAGAHGGIHDTSLLMFLGGDLYVRKDKLVAGGPVPGQPVDPSKPLIDNGVTGDPRPSTPEFGKLFFNIQIRNAVTQIRFLIDSTAKGEQ